MSKKRWTFDSICRAARKKVGRWRTGRMREYGDDDVVKCARGYCPLGVVFAWGRRKRPDSEWLERYAPELSQVVAGDVMMAADAEWNKHRPRMLKLLGIRA